MATRRMFSLKIINSARFLKMPIDSQVLYFHLGLRADDDGIVEAYPVMKMLGNTEDNLRVLVAKEFVRVLNNDLVSFITDWKEHNLIRADRKVDSIYKNLLLQIVPDVQLITPKPRADTKVIPKQPTGRPLDAIGKVRLGKVRLGKVSKESQPLADSLKQPMDNSKQPFPKPTLEQKRELAVLSAKLEDLQFNIFVFISKVKKTKGFYPPIKLMIETANAVLKKKPENVWGYFTEVLKKELPNYFADLEIQEHQKYKEMPIAPSIGQIMVGIGKEVEKCHL